VPLLERASKTAASASVVLIVVAMLVAHPDITWTLRAIAMVAFALGWLMASSRTRPLVQVWLIVASIAPAVLRLFAGREGPVLDIVWMAGLTGGLIRVTDWSRWTLPAPWNVLIGGWALALSLVWPVLVAREVGFRVSGLFDAGTINSWALMSGPQVVAWTLHVVLAQLLGALWFEWAWQALTFLKSKLQLVHGLWIGATVASIVALLQGTLDLGLLSTEFWAAERRTTGTMLDANAYGVCAALAAPIGFLGMRALAPRMPAAAVAVFALNWAGMWLSGSRTALLCGLVGTGGLIIGIWRERQGASQPRGATRVWLPVAAVAVFVVLMLAGTASPIRRALDIPISRAGLSQLWNRGGYGPIALRMTREYPLTGVGVGSYRVLAPDYWRAMANDALPLDNAQNWWRHQIAELGVFGSALVIAFSVLVGWRVLTSRTHDPDVAASSTVRGLLIGLGVTSLFGVPTQNPLVLLWFFALVAWFATLVTGWDQSWGRTRGQNSASSPTLTLTWAVACGLAIAFAAGHLVLARGSLSVLQRAERAQRDYVTGAYPPEPLPGANEFRWTGKDAHFVWPARTSWLVVRFWAHHPDIASQPVRVTLSTRCGVLFDEPLTSDAPMSVGITLPEGQREVDASVNVSRTWKPSDSGGDDARDLGVGIVADFVGDPSLAESTHRQVTLPGCSGGI
jgi:hypothetical protein